MSNDFCLSGTPKHHDAQQELLTKIEHDLLVAMDNLAELVGNADPLTEFGIRGIRASVSDAYYLTLALRTARNAHYQERP